MNKITILGILLFFTGFLSAATDGNLDLSFNNDGIVLTDFGSNAALKAVAIQADGKIVAAGYSQENGQNVFALFRYNADGSHDASFGSNGKIVTRFGRGENASGAQAVAVQLDGKIIAGGFTNAFRNSFRWCLARYNPDGSLDTSFMSGYASVPGTVITAFGTGDDVSQVNDLALQADGKIIAAGISFTRPNGIQFAVARYNVDGTLDKTGFNAQGNGSLPGTVRLSLATNGAQHDEAHAVAVQPNGKIVVAGCSFASGVKTFALARLQSNGALDNSFYSGGLATIPGTVVTSFAYGETDGGIYALVIQADEKIVAAGYTNSNVYKSDGTRFALARYDAQGRLDSSFGGQGLATVAGTVISSFGVNEQASRINGLVLQADGKLVAVGSSLVSNDTFASIARYNSDGSMDASFNKTTLQNSELSDCALQADGSLVSVGITNANSLINGAIVRYLSANSPLALPSISQPSDGLITIDGSGIQVKGYAQNPGLVSVLVNGILIKNLYVHGSANQWAAVLPDLSNGNYQISVLEQYNAGHVALEGLPVNINIDLNPKGIDASVSTCANIPVNGVLQASGASGNYRYTLLSQNNGSVILEGNTYTFTPSVAEGIGSFIFQVTDTVTNGTGTGIVTVAIKALPAAPNFAFAVSQDNALNGNLNNSISGIVAPYQFDQTGSVSNGALVLNADGSFNFISESGFIGDASFQYQITDGNGCVSELANVIVHVTQAPIANDGNLFILKNTQLKADLNQFVSSGKPPYNFVQVGAAVNGTVGIKNNGSFIFVPKLGFHGDASFQYQVTDASQGVSNIGTIKVTIQQLPAAANAAFVTQQNKLVNDSLTSLASQGLPPYVFSHVNAATNGDAQVDSDGSFTFAPAQDVIGVGTFNYAVTDANNLVSNVATVNVVINQTPIVLDSTLDTCQNTVLNGNLSALVSGGNPPYIYAQAAPTINGNVQINEDGSFTFTPQPGFNGTATFTYDVSDARSSISDAATVTINVIPSANASDVSLVAIQDSMLDGFLGELVTSGAPPYTFNQVGLAINGTVGIKNNGSFVFVPTGGFTGTASFQYQVTDANNCKSNIATVAIQVNPLPVVEAASALVEQAPTPVVEQTVVIEAASASSIQSEPEQINKVKKYYKNNLVRK